MANLEGKKGSENCSFILLRSFSAKSVEVADWCRARLTMTAGTCKNEVLEYGCKCADSTMQVKPTL